MKNPKTQSAQRKGRSAPPSGSVIPCLTTDFGFIFGAATVTRLCSDKRKAWIVIGITTPKYPPHGIQIYVTKSGKVRITDERGEWCSPNKQITNL